MFSFFKRPSKVAELPKGLAQAKLKIKGMHCAACSLNIDSTLEEIDGVVSSQTHYAKSTTEVVFNPELVSPAGLKTAIAELGYEAE